MERRPRIKRKEGGEINKHILPTNDNKKYEKNTLYYYHSPWLLWFLLPDSDHFRYTQLCITHINP